MKVLLTIIGIILADRAIPAGAWGYGVKFFKIDEKEFYQRYGIISFPRTVLGVCVCVAAGLNLVIPIDENTQALTTISLAVLFVISALVDVWRAGR